MKKSLANQYLIKKRFIMTVHNLYVYHCSNETLKIMKYRTPISMFNVFKTSNRKTTQMVTPTPDIQFLYIMQVLHGIGPDRLLNLILTLVTFLFHLQMQKLYLRITYSCLKKWAIHVSGISTGTSWCYFDFLKFDFLFVFLFCC